MKLDDKQILALQLAANYLSGSTENGPSKSEAVQIFNMAELILEELQKRQEMPNSRFCEKEDFFTS
ncbi:hypothetical protein B0T37_10560 [Chromobacterium violaceum]|uniref:hypothetical protein n=1 Tax=Chromobacterium violaceum TaxID=536 RepID=UPI0009DA319A|nr:hypothetical protein [Chromobacterium violaceum]OQS10082.1 hypothetical protein B0T38_10955 [Chromobacterium violaceum]OQS26497.1 hypothetical protein B0T37_10560 [Chromobacterium violaceum]